MAGLVCRLSEASRQFKSSGLVRQLAGPERTQGGPRGHLLRRAHALRRGRQRGRPLTPRPREGPPALRPAGPRERPLTLRPRVTWSAASSDPLPSLPSSKLVLVVPTRPKTDVTGNCPILLVTCR